MIILVKEFVDTDTAISYEDGKRCLEEILKYIDEENVVLDFQGVNYAITAFLNPVIGDLILNKGSEVMGKITIDNCNPSILNKIKMVMHGALLPREAIIPDGE